MDIFSPQQPQEIESFILYPLCRWGNWTSWWPVSLWRSHTGKRLCPCSLRTCAPLFSPCSEVRTSIRLAHMFLGLGVCQPWWWWWRGADMPHSSLSTAPLLSHPLRGACPFHTVQALPAWHCMAWSRFIYWPISCHQSGSSLPLLTTASSAMSTERAQKRLLKTISWMDGDSIPEIQIQCSLLMLLWCLMLLRLTTQCLRIIFGRRH